ncbi:hypothetical protein VHEMI02693 [[Torrubiella] hemipterigena]|uniref:Uncharacterized protein n=1 Tax=[Torrubiella] hemipterigena TaxID=1531966 RepID=A0A0A1SQH2_9HYPO|nr:hypothetical protein VHEMI02693 [[Torrubiella] hemipterigena]
MPKYRDASAYGVSAVHIVNREHKHGKKGSSTRVRKEHVAIRLRKPETRYQPKSRPATRRPSTSSTRRIALRTVGQPAMVYPDGTSAVRYVTPRRSKRVSIPKRVKFVVPQRSQRQLAAQTPRQTRVSPRENVDEDLIAGLCRQGIRCREISKALDRLRKYVFDSDADLLKATVKQVKALRAAIFQLVDYFDLYPRRLSMVLFYINAVYGTTSFTIQRILSILRDTSINSSQLWDHLLHSMEEALGGLELYETLRIYRDFLLSLSHLLKGDHPFDAGPVEELYDYTLQLRIHQGIGGAVSNKYLPYSPLNEIVQCYQEFDPKHWAETCLKSPLPSRRRMLRTQRSKSLGEHYPFAYYRKTDAPKILWRKSFDNNISAMIFLNENDNNAHMQLRIVNKDQPLFATAPISLLGITREDSCVKLHTLGDGAWRSPQRLWAVLSFDIWEELILFHAAFMSIKARHSFQTSMIPDDHFKQESIIYQTYITEAGRIHNFVILEDKYTGDMRLLAINGQGNHQGAPAWIIFLTVRPEAPWIETLSSQAVCLLDVYVYTFSDRHVLDEGLYGPKRDFQIEFADSKSRRKFEGYFPGGVIRRKRSGH